MKNCSLILLLLAAVLLLPGCEKTDSKPARVEISGPEGMNISVAGKNFKRNPLQLQLPAGEYIFKCTAPGYREKYLPVKLKPDEKRRIDPALVRQQGAVLIESKPSGATFTMGDKAYGTTPVVIDRLESGSYSGTLTMPGYADCTVTWQITNARPLRRYAQLNSNAGTLIIDSTLDNTRIFINGIEAGIAPLRLERTEGRHHIRAMAPNCEPQERTVELKREKETRVAFAPVGKPAVLTVESNPAGAEVFINGTKRGVTPCKLENMAAANYLVRVTLNHYEPQEREIPLIAGSSETVSFNLNSGVGVCRLLVQPAGVALALNGKPIGEVKPDPADAGQVLPVILRDLSPGDYSLTMSHPQAMPMRRTVKFTINKGKVTYVNQKLWVVNCEIVYTNGEERRGVIHAENPQNILFEFEPGAKIEIKRSVLRSIRRIGR